ncbi:MAG: DUF2239 family protein [Bacteriovorax sp.]|nr:DUF2239 family protein [Bacteriovorax sp.]
METINTYTAFDGHKLFGQGDLSEIVIKIKKQLGKSDNASIIIFSDNTGKVFDFNFQGTLSDVKKRLDMYIQTEVPEVNAGAGRPKLGVISREISLLPQHWEWLATQPGGSSSTLRKLVDEAKKKTSGGPSIKQTQEIVHRFASAMAGDFEGFEEALRALYRKDKGLFHAQMKNWPEDIRDYIIELSKPVFGN